MKRLFISQPMNGRSVKEIQEKREKILNYVETSLGGPVHLIDSVIQDAPVDAKPLWYLGKSIELMSTADIVFFAKGWVQARGCRIEHECALQYGIPCVTEKPFMKLEI